jgi:hypothetical protein
MNDGDAKLREALARIAEIASDAAGIDRDSTDVADDEDVIDGVQADVTAVCMPRFLPKRLLFRAAEVAQNINPVNALSIGPLAAVGAAAPDPLQIAVMIQKYWGPTPRKLSVSFMESAPANLRSRILGHMNAWSKTCSISFVQTNGIGDVRISREQEGYWSYLGTDISLIPKNRPTMSLQGFTMQTPDSEYKRVVRHETGHTLGMPHEHMRKALVARIDPQKAYAFFLQHYGWNRQMVDQQVLTALSEKSLMGTPPDQTSVMCYQLPGSITRDGKPITGGIDINATDYGFAGKIYPKPGHQLTEAAQAGQDWEESEDVQDVP